MYIISPFVLLVSYLLFQLAQPIKIRVKGKYHLMFEDVGRYTPDFLIHANLAFFWVNAVNGDAIYKNLRQIIQDTQPTKGTKNLSHSSVFPTLEQFLSAGSIEMPCLDITWLINATPLSHKSHSLNLVCNFT